MTSHRIKVLEDGTRVYSNYTRYVPLSDTQRTYRKRKPDVPGAVRWQGTWLLPLEVLPDEERTLPQTRPDTDAYDHASKPRKCRCDVCRRPEARRWRNQWRREQRQMRTAGD